MACEYDFQTTYANRIWFANAAPSFALLVGVVAYSLLKARPHIGDPAQRPVGQAITNELMERDWLLLEVMMRANMAMFFLFPTVGVTKRGKISDNISPISLNSSQVIKVYASAFHCTEFDFGSDGETPYMSASLTVECSTDKHQGIVVLAIASMLVPIFILTIFFVVLLPVVPHIEARTKRTGVSPVVDFFIGEHNYHDAPLGRQTRTTIFADSVVPFS